MAKTYNTLTELFTDIANAIRTKTKTTASIVADDFPQELENLKMGDALALIDGSIRTLKYNDLEGVETIRPYAFYGCNELTNVTIHNDVKEIGENAFGGCEKLTVINVPWIEESDVPGSPWGAENAEVQYTPESLAYTLNEDGESYTVTGVGTLDAATSIVIPRNYRAKPVTSIGDRAFDNCRNLTSITLPNSITNIGNGAFNGCTNLTSITLPNSITSIGVDAFNCCTNLTFITIPYSVTSIGANAFYNCTNLTSITIPDSVTSIGNSAFNSCTSLTSIIIPDSVTTIGERAFSYCSNLTSVTIPESVTSIGHRAFYNCDSLTSITYTGTMSKWNSITFGSNWNSNTGSYTIHCTDGDIPKSG